MEGMCPRAEAEAVDAMAATTKVVGGRVLVWYCTEKVHDDGSQKAVWWWWSRW